MAQRPEYPEYHLVAEYGVLSWRVSMKLTRSGRHGEC